MKEHEAPVMPIKARLSIFSVEYGNIDRMNNALVVTDRNGIRAQLPVGSTTTLLLEPGTTISHAAVKLCAESRTLIIWVGEGCVRLYCAGQEGSAHSYRLLRQARLAINPQSRLAVAKAMYNFRFGETPPARRSIEQLRGMEGARVRARYKQYSQQYNVAWSGRNFDGGDWNAQDTINRAVSAANSCLYGICHAAILIAGYSAAIGFVHTGYSLAFVHDIADLWKIDLSVPVAFRATAEGFGDEATRVRHLLRDEFRKTGFLEKVIPTIEQILKAGEQGKETPAEIGGAKEEIAGAWDAEWYTHSEIQIGEKGEIITPERKDAEDDATWEFPDHDMRQEPSTT